MTATQPDSHPDSLPNGPAEDVEQVSPTNDPGRESVEDLPTGTISEYRTGAGHKDASVPDSPGAEDNVSGTAGEVKVQDMHDDAN